MVTEKPKIKEFITKSNMRILLFGGKGGVGKTTCATSTAIWVAENTERKILILSTDPAHSISDSLAQDVSGGEPVSVEGVDNLYALEINPQKEFQKYQDSIEKSNIEIPQEFKTFVDFDEFQSATPPGSDESLSFIKVLDYILNPEYDLIIFDTAPTGHTIRLLSLPEVLDNFFVKLIRIRRKMGRIWGKFKGLFSRKDDGEEIDPLESLYRNKEIIEKARVELADPEKTSFIIVMIPELMAVYETERLIQTLYTYEIPISNIIINQIPPSPEINCDFCRHRREMYLKNIDQIRDLYIDDFNLIEIPLAPSEIRGIESLRKFNKFIFS